MVKKSNHWYFQKNPKKLNFFFSVMTIYGEEIDIFSINFA